MNEKYLIGSLPRSMKTDTIEMLKEINLRDEHIDINVEKFRANPKEVRKLLLPKTKLKCPECGETLYFDHETECEAILYCLHCDRKVKAKK